MEVARIALMAGGGLVGVFVLVRLGRWFFPSEDAQVDRDVRVAVEEGRFREAGDLQMRRGLYDRAARLFERGEEWGRLARARKKLGDLAGAAAAFETAGEHRRAAELYEALEQPEKAAACYAESEDLDDLAHAAELMFIAGRYREAGRLFQRARCYYDAARAFTKCDEVEPRDLVVTLLENAALHAVADKRDKILVEAARTAYQMGLHERAARALERAGRHARAAKLYAEIERFDLAAAVYTEIGQADEADTMMTLAGGELEVLRARQARAFEKGDDEAAAEIAARVKKLQTKSKRHSELPPAKDTNATVRERIGTPPAAVDPAAQRYKLIEELGRGGMGVVFRAYDKLLERQVALKFAPEGLDPQLSMLLSREARAAAQLSHPGVVTIFDVGLYEGRPFIAMELIHGEPLEDMLEERGKFSLLATLEVLEPVLEAVAYAHSAGVIHRDIKPANVMCLPNGQVKVMDFGIAKRIEPGASGQTSLIAGTPAYMPPEQLRGVAEPGSDVFALGALTFQLLTGLLPGDGAKHAYESADYPAPHERNPAVSRALSDLVMQCLSLASDGRPTVDALLAAVKIMRADIVARLQMLQ